jgi:hypothetical protein
MGLAVDSNEGGLPVFAGTKGADGAHQRLEVNTPPRSPHSSDLASGKGFTSTDDSYGSRGGSRGGDGDGSGNGFEWRPERAWAGYNSWATRLGLPLPASLWGGVTTARDLTCAQPMVPQTIPSDARTILLHRPTTVPHLPTTSSPH